MTIRTLTALLLLVFTGSALPAEFPTGTLKGTGFQVESGSTRISHEDLYAYNLSVLIVKKGADLYELTVVANLQRSASTPAVTDKRVGVFNVTWDSETTGTLRNTDAMYRDTTSTFTLSPTTLSIKSWIPRSQMWETHHYALPEKLWR